VGYIGHRNLGLFGANLARPSGLVSPATATKIGFVLHNRPLRRKSVPNPQSRDWLRFARLLLALRPEIGIMECWNSGMMGPSNRRGGENWVRFAHLTPPNWVRFERLARAGRRRQAAGQAFRRSLSPIRNPQWCHPRLRPGAAIRNRGIGFVSHNRAFPGARLAGNWVRFAHLTPANWVRFYNRLPATDYRLPLFGFVSHDGPTVASYFEHQTSHFKLLPFIRAPLMAAVLQESVRKSGFRQPPKSP